MGGTRCRVAVMASNMYGGKEMEGGCTNTPRCSPESHLRDRHSASNGHPQLMITGAQKPSIVLTESAESERELTLVVAVCTGKRLSRMWNARGFPALRQPSGTVLVDLKPLTIPIWLIRGEFWVKALHEIIPSPARRSLSRVVRRSWPTVSARLIKAAVGPDNTPANSGKAILSGQ